MQPATPSFTPASSRTTCLPATANATATRHRPRLAIQQRRRLRQTAAGACARAGKGCVCVCRYQPKLNRTKVKRGEGGAVDTSPN